MRETIQHKLIFLGYHTLPLHFRSMEEFVQGLPREIVRNAQRRGLGASHVTAHEIQADVAHGVHTRNSLTAKNIADADDRTLESFNVGHNGAIRGVV
jgi:hypothetical protein